MAYDVIITWMDGQQETYRADDYPRVRDGELCIVEYYGITGGVKEGRHFPLANVRVWKAESR